MSLVWEYIDIFLGRVRGVQQYYEWTPDTYWGLYLNDYIYVSEKVVEPEFATGSEIGPKQN